MTIAGSGGTITNNESEEEDMSKKKKIETEEVKQEVAEQKPNLTHTAVGLAQIPETREWVLVKIRYNPSTGQMGELERSPADDRGHGIERFKVEAARDVLTFD